ncbi:DUF1851 domain-containing protein [bacterium]|nr:DUF1851 domain-containing protein [bacterium]
MTTTVTDYLIDLGDTDWSGALASWSWLLPETVTLWLVNRFADLFVVLADGSVHMLDVGAGTFNRVAASRDEFCTRIDDTETAAEWLMIPLVDRLVEAGVRLGPGQCYGFKTPPILGGDYAIENVGPLPVADYLGACGAIHAQLKDLPDGSQVELKVTE